MAITIRNKKIETIIREIGRRTGEGPSELLGRLAEAKLAEMDAERRAAAKRRLAAWEELDKEFPPPSEEEKEAMRRDMETMYDYLEEEDREADNKRATS